MALAPSNLSTSSNLDQEYGAAIQKANSIIANLGLKLTVPGVLGVETDQGLVNPIYRVENDGDRVVVFGRWIVDCGHKDFHTEIHSPLLLAVARAAGTLTSVRVISRPFLVSQDFGDGALRQHLLNEIGKVEGFASTSIDAIARVLLPPFTGTQRMSFFVKPPTPRQSPNDTLLLSCHFTVRSGVTVEVTTTPFPDEIQVLITMNEADYQSAPLQPKRPPYHTTSIQVADLGSGALGAGVVFGIVYLLTNVYGDIILAQGINSDLYDAPAPQSIHDSENAARNVVVDQNMGTITPFSVGDDQPFPIYGSLTLQWG